MFLLFDIVASRCAGFRIVPAFLFSGAEGRAMEAALTGTLILVQALTAGIATFGADRVVAYKVEAY
jgi:hypothetical protein